MALLKPNIYRDDHIGGTGHGTPSMSMIGTFRFFLPGAGIKPDGYDKPVAWRTLSDARSVPGL